MESPETVSLQVDPVGVCPDALGPQTRCFGRPGICRAVRNSPVSLNHAMARAVRLVLMTGQVLSNPADRGAVAQRLGQVAAGGHAPGRYLC